MVLRSDEAANQAEIERDQRMRGNVGKGIKTAAALGSAAIGGPIVARVMPFLSEYIPANLAMKGIEKVSPKLGSFLKKGQDMGLDIKEGLNFIKEKMGNQEPAKEHRNIIEQYDPHLFTYLKELIGMGLNPIQAADKSRKVLDKKHQEVIKKIEQDHKTDWSSIVQTVFGNQMAQPEQQQQMNPQQQPSPQQGQQTQQTQQMPQQGGGDQAKQQLLQAMQALSQKLRS